MKLTDSSLVEAQYRASHRDHPSSVSTLAEGLRLVADGDRKAFGDVYRQTAGKLLAVCLQIIQRRGDAEDVLQDVYCAVWHRADLFDAQRGSAMTWLITIARNRAIDHLRRSRSGLRSPIEMADQAEDPHPLAHEILEADQERRKMHRCLDAMDEQHASALRKAFFGGSTYSSLALAAGVPVATMKSRIRRALRQLRDDMA